MDAATRQDDSGCKGAEAPTAHPEPAWHSLEAPDLVLRLDVDPRRGLDGLQVNERLRRQGPNVLPKAPPRALWRVFARQFASPLVLILFAAAALAAALGHHGDSGVILSVVLVNALVGLVQEGRAERSMAALRRLSQVQVRVLREGTESLVLAAQLVPGDLVLLAAGDAVAADARLLEQAQLHAAEAALTGESVPVAKTAQVLPPATGLADRRNMVFSGTYVTAGRARAVVVATAAHTQVGRIARLTAAATEPDTPLQERIGRFGRALVAAAFGLFVLVLLLGLWRQLPLADVLMVAISQMVSMVPEGLPVAMTIALAVGMQRMARQGVIIRRLAAVETLGSTTVICSDKTGTLTRNEMTVTRLWLPPEEDGAARRIDVGGTGYAPEGGLAEDGAPLAQRSPALQAMLEAAALCNDAQLLPPQDGTGWRVAGDPTEGALLVLALKAGLDLQALRAQAPRAAELPFDSDAKLMATLHAWPGARRRGLVKGAPEAVLRLCAGQSPLLLRAARACADEMSSQALRVLAFAEVEDGALELEGGFGALAGRVRLLGLAGQIDPPREEARQAVADCRAAGIRPVMVTGDHKLTGLAIARALGIARPGDLALDGEELERMGEAQLRAALPGIAVFARVQPAQKLRIVEALQAGGEVVAMTGDGVNDAPALARADIGVAMGITGTEVAKSAARIVITDDNFATIVHAVEQGRVVYGNLKKVILFLFATSVDEIALLLLALLAGYPLPLAAVQILWINIVTEGTLTVNLVMEPADGREMRRPPVPRTDPLLDRLLLQRVALMAALTVAVCFGWFAWRLAGGGDIAAVRTETFTLLAMCQWFNVLNCQSATRTSLGPALLRNRWLLGGLLLSIALQLAVLYLPVMNAMLHTVPLTGWTLLLLAGLGSTVLWGEELRKLVARQ
ncbi:cation-translocating P-type ATPase [Ramlibacter sp. Leaf400]|uniref:cation-translocating P-type ATPase n=1 Tax=Ramlibacter sp. Leaf400 TaxID=1736365 RepID=UPI0006FBB942|nr:HAD-IC family P-type ATPase [Ramlibacter sp. Leaf400]KQT10873.1 haloacid dehalogenase [Ramlibacter sp. Leaf400]